MEKYAQKNTLIYSTHLPFMIDLRFPQRIRVLSETPTGVTITDNLTSSQPEAKLVLQSALGMSGATSWLVAENNLVVEGINDYWLISEFSRLLIRSGEAGLADDLMITPAGGASEAAYMATFMIGQQLNVVALFDSDDAGNAAREHLLKNWLMRYREVNASLLSIGDNFGINDHDCMIEDIFDEVYYSRMTQEAYAKPLKDAGVKTLTLANGKDGILSRTKRTLDKHGIQFNKGSVAKRIRADLMRMNNTDTLSDYTLTCARNLIAAINAIVPN